MTEEIADCRSWTRVLLWRELRRKRAWKKADRGANKNVSFACGLEWFDFNKWERSGCKNVGGGCQVYKALWE